MQESINVSRMGAFATVNAARAAQKSADSLPVIEGAYVYPVVVEEFIAGTLSSFDLPHVPTNRLSLKFVFKNFGRTPAVIQFYQGNLIHPDYGHLRAVDADSNRIVKKTVLGTGDETEPLYAEMKDVDRDEAVSIKGSKTHLYFTGQVVYADTWGDRWVFPFDWEYSPTQSLLMPDNKPRKKTN